MLSVDGTDFRIAMGYCKPFWSYKFKKSGLRYEVGLCILTGDICWWSGPYAPGVCGCIRRVFTLRFSMCRNAREQTEGVIPKIMHKNLIVIVLPK